MTLAPPSLLDPTAQKTSSTRFLNEIWGSGERWSLTGTPDLKLLYAMERKFKLVQEENETLKNIVQLLFKDWFVDFGPVHAKMQNQQPYLPSSLWELFPSSFNGKIPSGWKLKPLSEIATFLNGLPLQKYVSTHPEDVMPVIKIPELRHGFSEKTHMCSRNIPAKYIIKDGDFLFSWSGTLIARFWFHGEGALNQHLFKVTSQQYPAWFFAGWVQFYLDEFRRIADGKATTMGHIKRGHLRSTLGACPPDHFMECFDSVLNW